MSDKISLKVNPSRVCYGLSRIGYNPTSAICDIVDNSVVAKSKNIYIKIIKENEHFEDNRKNNVREYLIIDDGNGMSYEDMINALSLGSDPINYTKETLSKFGLGLKSAGFSQGERIELISGKGDGEYNKLVVDLENISDDYYCSKSELTKQDMELIEKYIYKGKGTVVKIGKVRKENHPSVKNTLDDLKYKLGVIYYYFLIDKLNIYLENEKIQPVDVLFTDEADRNGNLVESEWDGKSVQWIQTLDDVQLDSESGVKGKIEVTQLPYPPIFEVEKLGSKKEIRDKYRIKAGNYGYYVYRNKRLISWAEGFDGIIPLDQEFYSFRGRILINSSGDDCFNIDVKKAHIKLSDDAQNTLQDLSDAYKRKSKKAWNTAKRLVDQINGKEPNNVANEIAEILRMPESLPGDAFPTTDREIEKSKRDMEIQNKLKEKIKNETKIRLEQEKGKKIDDENINQDDINKTIKGDDVDKGNEKIFRVPSIEDNLLWEPYYDAEIGMSVRINRNHRFARVLFEDNSDNVDLQVIFELFSLQLANAEIYAQKNIQEVDRVKVEQILIEYRRIVSEFLATMCRNSKLPPLNGDR